MTVACIALVAAHVLPTHRIARIRKIGGMWHVRVLGLHMSFCRTRKPI